MRERIAALQRRILASPAPLPPGAKALFKEMLNVLREAADEGKLRTSVSDILKLLQKDDENDGKSLIVGGFKDFDRSGDKPRFVRDDGASFHFTLTVAERQKSAMDLIAYDFELYFPPDHEPAFVRFDLNPPGHDNEARGLRSHVHPGSDDFSAPAPLMSPLELLEIMIYGLRHEREPRS